MSVKKIPCKDVKVIKNGTTTAVIAETNIRFSNQFKESVYDLTNMFWELQEMPIISKGVSKLCPGDEYNEETGRIIASKKAEIKGNRIAKHKLENLAMTLSVMQGEILGYIMQLSMRDQTLTTSIKNK